MMTKQTVATGWNQSQLHKQLQKTGCMQLQLQLWQISLFGNRLRLQLHPNKAKNRTQPDFQTLITYYKWRTTSLWCMGLPLIYKQGLYLTTQQG